MADSERALKVLELLRQEYPGVKGTALRYSNALELLVATILSAQCTDAKVNQVTLSLFERYRTPEDYANAPLGELEEAVKPIWSRVRQIGLTEEDVDGLIQEAKAQSGS